MSHEIMQQPERVAAAKRELVLEFGEFFIDLAITEDVEIDEI